MLESGTLKVFNRNDGPEPALSFCLMPQVTFSVAVSERGRHHRRVSKVAPARYKNYPGHNIVIPWH